MITSKMNLLPVCMLLIIATRIYCSEKTETYGNEVEHQKPTIHKADEDDDDDDLGERFLSLLSEKLKLKLIKNKAANEGILDPTQFPKEQMTKEELEEVQAALVQAMQPLFGRFISEFAETDIDDGDRLEIVGPADKKDIKEEAEGEANEELNLTEKKSPSTKKEKNEDTKAKKDKKVEGKTVKSDKPNSKKENKEGKVKIDIEKDKKKTESSKEEKDTRLKEEL